MINVIVNSDFFVKSRNGKRKKIEKNYKKDLQKRRKGYILIFVAEAMNKICATSSAGRAPDS